MKFLSLFSGIGAPESAFKRIGYDIDLVNYCEIDKYASKSYSAIHNTPESLNLWDVTKINPHELPDFDMVFHGSPCQSFSVAGKGDGGQKDSGTRSSLMWYTVEIVKVKQPKVVMWENVKGVLSKKHRETFDEYLNEMAHLGYNNYWKLLNTKDYGVPQNRERVFVISIRTDVDTFADRLDGFPWKEKFDNGLRLKDFLERNVDERYYLKSNKLVTHNQDVSYAIDANYHKGASPSDLTNSKRQVITEQIKNIIGRDCEIGVSFKENGDIRPHRLDVKKSGIQELMINSVENVANTISTNHMPKILEPNETICLNSKVNGVQPKIQDRIYDPSGVATAITTAFPTNYVDVIGRAEDVKGHDYNKRVYSTDGVSPSIAAHSGGNLEPKVVERTPLKFLDRNGKQVDGDYAFCVDTAQTGGVKEIDEVGFRIRKLTPKECWRLQGFTDEEFETAAEHVSNTQLYKQAGNSITVDVLVYIFKELVKVFDEVQTCEEVTA